MHRAASAVGPVLSAAIAIACLACADEPPRTHLRASGYVEATEVRVAAEVGGRVVERPVTEGQQVAAGDLIAQLDTTDVALAQRRTRAELDQARAQLALLVAGARVEDIRQAAAQAAAAEAELAAARAELDAAATDLARFESLLAADAGSRKQRDDAATREAVATGRVRAAEDRAAAAMAAHKRLQAGARPEEIDAAGARVAAVEAQLAALDEAESDARILAPTAGTVTETVVEVGELLPAGAPVALIADLRDVWANVYVPEPDVPRIRLGGNATLFTDAGGPGIPGRITYVSPTAEFTPRNVQTAEERSRLVYRVKVAASNESGVLKQGMPVESEIPLAPVDAGPP